jgi:hypothetical protein
VPKIDNNSLAEYKDAFNKAESAIKEVERLADTVVIAAINQLRYSTYHYLRSQAQLKKSSQKEKEEFKKAINHCHRAYYDAYEAGISYLLHAISRFKRQYRIVPLKRILPEVESIYEEVRGIQKWLKDTSDEKSKEIFYQLITTEYQKLKNCYDKLDSKREDIKSHFIRWGIGTVISIFISGLILNILATFLYDTFIKSDQVNISCLEMKSEICSSPKEESLKNSKKN